MTSKNSNASTSGSTESYLAALDHPLKQEIIAIREIILTTDPRISENIKWNVPSFRTTEFFATFHLRFNEFIQVILHFGAKQRDITTTGITISDPESILEWLAKDRASVKCRNMKEVEMRQTAFTNIIRQWIQFI